MKSLPFYSLRILRLGVIGFWRLLQFCFLLLLLVELNKRTSRANQILELESFELLPNKSGQIATLFLKNDGASPVNIGGLDLAIQIADGGKDAGGIIDGPIISSIDFLTGTLFQSFTPVIFADSGNVPQRGFWSITVPALGVFPEIPAHSQAALATIEFDTTKLFFGTFDLHFLGSAAGDTAIYDSFDLPLLGSDIQNHKLTIAEQTVPGGSSVPEAGTGLNPLLAILWTSMVLLGKKKLIT